MQADSQTIYIRADHLEIRPHAKYIAGRTGDGVKNPR